MKTFVALFCLTVVVANVQAAQSCSDPIRAGTESFVELTGVVDKEKHWGPPNFGEDPEHDSAFTAYVVHLDIPSTLGKADGSPLATNLQIEKIQLLPNSSGSVDYLRPFVGKHSVISGQLWLAVAAGDVTPVTMTVKSIRGSAESFSIRCLAIR